MPQVFKIGSYVIFIWYAESNPLEPIHVHVSEGVPSENATKIWLTNLFLAQLYYIILL